MRVPLCHAFLSCCSAIPLALIPYFVYFCGLVRCWEAYPGASEERRMLRPGGADEIFRVHAHRVPPSRASRHRHAGTLTFLWHAFLMVAASCTLKKNIALVAGVASCLELERMRCVKIRSETAATMLDLVSADWWSCWL